MGQVQARERSARRDAPSSGGRIPAGEIPARRDAVLDAAAAELAERGYEATTMLAVARRAGASKETLYVWFGNKEGLFAALIRRNAERANARVAEALASDAAPEAVLAGFATELLRLLLGEGSLAINRAAMHAPDLARVLLEHGRFRTGALVEGYLAGMMERGVLRRGDPAAAFQLLYGVVIEDRQIRALLGEPVPADDALAAHARQAVRRFMALMGDSREGA